MALSFAAFVPATRAKADDASSSTPESVMQMAVASDATNGTVVGEVTEDGTGWVQEGSQDSGWTQLPYTGVTQIEVASDPVHGPLVAVLLDDGSVHAYQGGAGGLTTAGNWVQETTCAVSQGQMAVASDSANGPLIGEICASDGHAYVKEGGLSAGWVDENADVTDLALASDPTNGPLIGVVDSTGTSLVKEGGLSAGWVSESANVRQHVLASAPTSGADTRATRPVRPGGPIIGIVSSDDGSGNGLQGAGIIAGNSGWVDETPGFHPPPSLSNSFLIANGGYSGQVICAQPGSTDLVVLPLTLAIDPYCLWQQSGPDNDAFLYNRAVDRDLDAGVPRNNGAVFMQPYFNQSYTSQQWSWSGDTGYGGRALRPYTNSDLNIGATPSAGQLGLALQGWSNDSQAPYKSWTKVGVSNASSPTVTMPTNPNPPPNLGGDMIIQSSAYPGSVLCATSASGTAVQQLSQTISPYCLWQQGGPNGAYLYNPALDKVLDLATSGPINDRTSTNLQPYYTNPLQSYEQWNWSGQTGWGGRALRPVDNLNENLNANYAFTFGVAVTPWGWVSQQAMTWNTVPVTLQSAVVSLGDSFISGEGGRWQGNSDTLADNRDGTDRAWTGSGYDPYKIYGSSYANECNRSDSAEVRSATGIAQVAINLACSGATTANIFRAANGGQSYKGEQPQADQLVRVALQYKVKVIALSIGGNDLGFSGIIADCVRAYLNPLGAPCNTAQQAIVNSRIATTKQNIAKAISEIRAAMTSAGYTAGSYRIILQSAPSPLPRAAETRYPQGTGTGRSTVGGCPFYDADLNWARDQLGSQMADAQKSVAQTAGVDFMDLRNAFQGREVCSTATSLASHQNPPMPVTSEWARFLVSGLGQGQQQESFHPNYYGQLALGRCLTLMAAATSAHIAACNNTRGQTTYGMTLTITS